MSKHEACRHLVDALALEAMKDVARCDKHGEGIEYKALIRGFPNGKPTSPLSISELEA